MSHLERPIFGTQKIIEQMPFKDPAVQRFFKKWCEINSSIEPEMIDREAWEAISQEDKLSGEKADGKKTLYIPEDLQLWEIIGIIEPIDQDTFGINKPERTRETREKILSLGKTFRNAGIYIAERLNSIDKGREIAEALALEFFNYGQSLIGRNKSEKLLSLTDISSQRLTPEEIEAVEHFWAEEALYKSRIEKSGEAKKLKTLSQFFRVAEMAFRLRRKTEERSLKKAGAKTPAWRNDSPIHSAFIARVEEAMARKIEEPKRELGSVMFRRGMELVQKNMPFDKLPGDVKRQYLQWENGEGTLREALQIDRLKEELAEVRNSGDITRIVAKEQQIANKIQMVISKFPKKLGGNNPREMLVNQYINCVGASILSGVFMQEVGLKYLVATIPKHSMLFLITSDGKVAWGDIMRPWFNKELSNETISGNKEDKSSITTTDIVAFSQEPKPEGLMFDWLKEGEKRSVKIFGPDDGQKIQVLYNTGKALSRLGWDNEAILAYQEIIKIDPQNGDAHAGLGDALFNLDRKEEAVVAYRRTIAIDPKSILSYVRLGNLLSKLDREKEAIETYKEFLVLANKKDHQDLIRDIRKEVSMLEKKLSFTF